MSSEVGSKRPRTHRARGICKYYTTPRGCFNGRNCKFMHGEDVDQGLTPYDQNKTCKFYAAGYCHRGSDCWFQHSQPDKTVPPTASSSKTSSLELEDDACSICSEKPVTYGLLASCSHVFCLECIRKWRDPTNKSDSLIEAGTTKKCPYCRASSRFITPSSVFYPEGSPEKVAVIAKYKESMARVPCRYFYASPKQKRFCPFGQDCFYKHSNADGTPYLFPSGVDHYMQLYRARRRGSDYDDNVLYLFDDPIDFETLRVIMRILPEALHHGDDEDESQSDTTDRRRSPVPDEPPYERLTHQGLTLQIPRAPFSTLHIHHEELGIEQDQDSELPRPALPSDEDSASPPPPTLASDAPSSGSAHREAVDEPPSGSTLSDADAEPETPLSSRSHRAMERGRAERLRRDSTSSSSRADSAPPSVLAPLTSDVPRGSSDDTRTHRWPVSGRQDLDLASVNVWVAGSRDEAIAQETARLMDEVDTLERMAGAALDLDTLPAPAPQHHDERHAPHDTNANANPPFLTDGRGRVVWSSPADAPQVQKERAMSKVDVTDAGEAEVEVEVEVPEPRGQVHQQTRLDDFVTDGRGRVVMTGGSGAVDAPSVAGVGTSAAGAGMSAAGTSKAGEESVLADLPLPATSTPDESESEVEVETDTETDAVGGRSISQRIYDLLSLAMW